MEIFHNTLNLKFVMSTNNIHLFYISNYIVFNNYLSIIIKEDLSLKNCFFYSPRLSVNDLNIKAEINLVEIENFKIHKSKLKIIQNYVLINSKINAINKNLDYKKYILYVPHLINDREKILLYNKNCVKYHFVEEGFPAYRKENDTFLNLDWSKIHFKNNFFVLGNIPPLLIYKKKYAGCYGNQKKSFNNFPNKKIIELNFNHPLKKLINFNIYEDSHIIGIDSLEDWSNVNNYLQSLRYLSLFLKNKKIKTLFIKFHPSYNYDSINKKKILNIFFDSKIYVEEIQTYCEEMAANVSKLKFYNLTSTLMIYMGYYNQRIILFDKYLENKDEKYSEYSKNLKKILSDLNIKTYSI